MAIDRVEGSIGGDEGMTVRGGCLCGIVEFEVDLPFTKFVKCHCSRCRGATGSAFATNAYVLPPAFRWRSGQDRWRASTCRWRAVSRPRSAASAARHCRIPRAAAGRSSSRRVRCGMIPAFHPRSTPAGNRARRGSRTPAICRPPIDALWEPVESCNVLSRKGESMNRTALIGVDWGTTSMRLWGFSLKGEIIARKRSENGILKVADARFRETLEAVAGDLLAPAVPVLMSGMIGSRQGWVEAPYVFCPADVATLADQLQPVPAAVGVQIVPGVAVRDVGGRRDVMRGEETQILGAGLGHGRQLVVLPGTHCKWVLIEDG